MLGLSAFLISAICLVGTAFPADWPRWRGPGADSIYPDDDWNPAALSEGPARLWDKNVSSGYSGVAVRGDLLYTMGNSGKVDYVSCFNVNDGEVVWTHSYPCKPPQYPGPRGTPFIEGDRVYTFSSAGDLFCLDAATGDPKWSVKVTSALRVRSPKWGFASSPVIEGDMVIVNAGRHGMAFDKMSGEKVWDSGKAIGGYSTPVVYELEGRKFVAIFGQKAAYGVALDDGKQIWSFPWETEYDVNAADPVVFEHFVFITSGYDRGCALLDISGGTAKKLWENTTIASQFGTSVYIDGYLYGISGNAGKGTLVCLEAKSGKAAWRHKLAFGSVMAAGGNLIVLTELGDLYLVTATPDSYKEVGRGKAFTPKKGRIWTMPILANGRLYVRSSEGDLACFDLRK
jgi:outer membrane protein assembly factor BamB